MLRQFRFVHLGVVGLLTAAALTGVGLAREVAAVGAGTPSVFVPIVPCRLVDTRGGNGHVGTRANPLAQAESATFAVWGTNGNCTIPTMSTGIATNVTAVNSTADSFVTIYPADAPRPTASNLNVTASSPPTPNQVTVELSATGAIDAYNNGGTLDLIVDIVGYYQPATPGSAGPPGPAGPAGSLVGGTQYVSGYDTAFWVTNTPGSTYIDEQNCVAFQGQLQTGELPLDLPIGATITTLQVRYVDKSAGGLIMSLHHGEPGISDALVQDLVSIGTNASDYHRSDQFDVSAQTPVTAQNEYSIKLFSQFGTSPTAIVQFCGALVTYTLPTTPTP